MFQSKQIQDNINQSASSEQDTLDTIVRISSENNDKTVEVSRLTNTFIENKRMILFPVVATLLLGAFFNAQFQSFIKSQLMSQMDMSSSDYQLFVLIPTLPTIILPLIIGPILDIIGARLGILIFTFLLSVGMGLCMVSIAIESFVWILIGKTILQISVECQGISHGCVVGKWFTAKGLTTTFAITSFFCKVASSTSGIIYPQLYNSTQSLMTPLSVGIGICGFTLINAVIIFYFDKTSDKFEPQNIESQNEQEQKEKKKFKLSDIKKFDKMFWLYAIQCPLMFGTFYAFLNYLQSVLIHKFLMDETLAGELVSVPYWIAFSTPIFGLLADKYGKRSYFLIFTAFLPFVSVLMLLLTPSGQSNYFIIYISLSIFGIFLSAMCSYLYPTLPLLSQKEYLTTAFAICYSTKNGGTALLNYLGGFIIGKDEEGYNAFLLTYTIIFFVSFVISILMTLYDRKHGSILNSTTPQRYLDYIEVKRSKRLLNSKITQTLLSN